jgi:hypothetical protein
MVEQDFERENRIDNEIVVDAYNAEEQRMGWYYYLEDKLNFPFWASWDGEKVEVIGMSEEEECHQKMYVEVRYQEDGVEDIFSAALVDITPIEATEKTVEAIEDWKYWVEREYDFNE